MAAKHTPGPLAVIASASGKPLIVADHPHHDGDVARMARDTPEAWATARLFAAAPDMLDACRQQHSALDALMALCVEHVPGFMPTKSEAWAAVVAGHAAIAKAVQS